MRLGTEIFQSEGKQNVRAVIRNVAKASNTLGVQKIIIFASSASNVVKLRKALPEGALTLVVTFPAGMVAAARGSDEYVLIGMPSTEDRRTLRQMGIPLLQGVMPMRALGEAVSPAISTMKRVFALLGGGVELCVQAVLMATDAGYLSEGERCIVMSADTALVMRAGNAFRFMQPHSKVAIEHVLCKPLTYQISRSAATPVTEGADSKAPGAVSAVPTALPHDLKDVTPRDPAGPRGKPTSDR